MAKKFKKNGNVNFNSNPNINAAFNGNLQIQSPNFEVTDFVIHSDFTVDISAVFYETNKNSNPAVRTFTFSVPGNANWVGVAFAAAEDQIKSMSELSGSTEV